MTQPGQSARPPQFVEGGLDPQMTRDEIATSIGVHPSDLERWQWSRSDGHYVVFVRDHEFPDQNKVFYTWPEEPKVEKEPADDIVAEPAESQTPAQK